VWAAALTLLLGLQSDINPPSGLRDEVQHGTDVSEFRASRAGMVGECDGRVRTVKLGLGWDWMAWCEEGWDSSVGDDLGYAGSLFILLISSQPVVMIPAAARSGGC